MDIKLEAVSKNYCERVLFENLNIVIKQGDFLVIMGQSGSGKTTLGSIIGGMENPTSGSIKYSVPKKNLYRHHLGFIFQNYGLLDNEDVFLNLKFAFVGKNVKNEAKMCEQALRLVGLDCKLTDKVKTLSGGEKQRLAITRVLLKNPDVLIADEPTGNLDQKNTQIINDLLIKLHKKGKTVILITHKPIDYSAAKILNL